MPLMTWFNRKKPVEEVEPHSGVDHDGEATPLSRKSERTARRELLYTVVRECMIKASVLSSHYRFKVLSLDKRGRQALLMIDLDGPMGGGAAQLGQIERDITQMAKARHGLVVKAVYWRQVSGAPVLTLGTRVPAEPGKPADKPAEPQAAPVVAKAPEPAAPARSPYDPIDATEVAAFRKALADGVARPARAADADAAHAERNYTLLTGFEDTELRDISDLGMTQQGSLR